MRELFGGLSWDGADGSVDDVGKAADKMTVLALVYYGSGD